MSCVGCGYCCKKAPCGIATRIYGNGITECPELIYVDDVTHPDGGWYRCRLCTLPGEIGDRYREELYVGAGCCSSLNSARQEILRGLRTKAPKPNESSENIRDELPRELLVFLKHLSGSFVSSDALWLALNSTQHELNLGADWRDRVLVRLAEFRSKSVENFMG